MLVAEKLIFKINGSFELNDIKFMNYVKITRIKFSKFSEF
jgi:hypothetical protein